MQTCGCGGRWCNGILQKADPRQIIDGKVYSLNCGWKLEKQLKEKKDADQVREGRGSDPSVPSK